jgi:hypothetical protein
MILALGERKISEKARRETREDESDKKKQRGKDAEKIKKNEKGKRER